MSKDLPSPLVLASANLSQSQINLLLEVVSRLTGANGPGWEEHLKKVLRSEPPNQAIQFSELHSSLLKLVNPGIQINAISAYDPMQFKDCDGLRISEPFKELVLSKAKPIENLGATTLMSFDLTARAGRVDVLSDPVTPPYPMFGDESQLLAWLDTMLDTQKDGQGGDLLNNGQRNIFYLIDREVYVVRYPDIKTWDIRAYQSDNVIYSINDRVFIPVGNWPLWADRQGQFR